MVRLHSTRLMEAGEIALWRDGEIVWTGLLGSQVSVARFDAVSFSAFDASRMTDLIGGKPASAEVLRAAIAEWWGERRFEV